jgi:hypothetical protein
METVETVIFVGGFESGAEIFRDGKRIATVPPCTWWDDPRIRVIDRDGEAVVQEERRCISGNRSWPTDEWADIASLGPVEGLDVVPAN